MEAKELAGAIIKAGASIWPPDATEYKLAKACQSLQTDKQVLEDRVAELETWKEGAVNFYPDLERMVSATTILANTPEDKGK